MAEQLTPCPAMQSYLSEIASDRAFEDAERGNEIVLLPKDNELFIDLDSEDALTLFNKRLKRLGTWHITTDKQIRPSKKKNHYHAIVTLETNTDPMQRIFLQLFLGSDPIRELLSLQRILIKDPHPTLFFEKKENEQ